MPKLPLNSFLLIGLLGIDGCWMSLIFQAHPTMTEIRLVLCAHFIICVAISLILPRFLASNYRKLNSKTFAFFFTIAFFMPLLGLLGLVTAILPGLREIKSEKTLVVQYTKPRSLSESQKNNDIRYENPPDNLENLLHSQDPVKRMQAVYATLKLEDKNAIPLLKLALRDPVDDIRLLAYALIDRKEQRISERIEKTKQNLEDNLNLDNLHLYKSIAHDYWEIAHLGLVEGETLNFILSKARQYLEQGLQLYPEDRGLHFLYGKLLLKLGRFQESFDEFNMAENLGISKQKLLLYYAEIDFKLGRYQQVKQKMKEIIFTSARPEIAASAQFWLEAPVGR